MLAKLLQRHRPEFDYPLEIKRSRRKTSALIIKQGKLELRIPLRTSQYEINALLNRHRAWIDRKIAEDRAKPDIPVRQFLAGECFQVLGMAYPLTILSGHNKPLTFSGQEFVIGFKRQPENDEYLATMQRRFAQWYRSEASRYFEQRLLLLAGQTGLQPSGLKVRSYRTRWGSCNSRGDIRLNWKLLMAPVEVIDYVMVHELCHLVHLNHSRAFWQTVEKHLPDYRQQQQWLKTHGYHLTL